MPHITLHIKIAMWVAFFALTGAWWWLVHQAVYRWLPEWITVPVGFGFLAFSACLYARELWLRRKELRRDRLTSRAE